MPTIRSRVLHIYTETAVHAGGSESVGGIDLPIQRETATQLPLIWGQSLRGALRSLVSNTDGDLATRLFGSGPTKASTDDSTQAGNVFVGDARLLAFPVATLQRTFAWATSPLCLGRVGRLPRQSATNPWDSIPTPTNDGGCGTEGWKEKQVLGAYQVTVTTNDSVAVAAASLANTLPSFNGFQPVREKAAKDLLVVTDELLKNLAIEGTDMVTRVKLDNKKQVEQLFVEEYLPSETFLAAPLGFLCSSEDESEFVRLISSGANP